MSTILAKVKYLAHRVPAPVRAAAEHVVIVAATTFVATAKPLLPQLVATPSLTLAKAALLTAAAAALAAGYQAAKAAVRKLSAKWEAIPVEPQPVSAPTKPTDPATTTTQHV